MQRYNRIFCITCGRLLIPDQFIFVFDKTIKGYKSTSGQWVISSLTSWVSETIHDKIKEITSPVEDWDINVDFRCNVLESLFERQFDTGLVRALFDKSDQASEILFQIASSREFKEYMLWAKEEFNFGPGFPTYDDLVWIEANKLVKENKEWSESRAKGADSKNI